MTPSTSAYYHRSGDPYDSYRWIPQCAPNTAPVLPLIHSTLFSNHSNKIYFNYMISLIHTVNLENFGVKNFVKLYFNEIKAHKIFYYDSLLLNK